MVLVLLITICATSLLVNMGFLRLFKTYEGYESSNVSSDVSNNPLSSSTISLDSSVSRSKSVPGASSNSIPGATMPSNPLSPSSVLDPSTLSTINKDLDKLTENNKKNESIANELKALVAQTSNLMTSMAASSPTAPTAPTSPTTL